MRWNFQDHVATWQSQSWTTKVDLKAAPRAVLSHPTLGSLNIHFSPQESGQRESVSALSPEGFLPVGECYVRQNDLVAAFPEATPFRFGYQLYFCAIPTLSGPPDSMGMDIWLSVQTSTLESHPQVALRFDASRWQEARAISDGLHLANEGACGLLIHPLDRNDCQWQVLHGNQTLVTFGRFMEKGVIRRMRLRLIAANPNVPESQWKHWMEQFAESPLPLTA